MKKIFYVLLALFLICYTTACGSKENSPIGGSESTANISAQESNEPVPGISLSEEQNPESEGGKKDQTAGNILIVYFSRWGNTDYPDDVDATTSASIVADGDARFGTTEFVAEQIRQITGGDIHRIETVDPYTADFDELRDVNHAEMQQGVLPELKESNLDISGYDTVFVGYPVWATSVPQAVLSFLNEYDLSGKTVVPFCTHDGYGAGRSYQVIADASHAAVSPEGLAIEAKDVPEAQNTIADWLEDIGISGLSKKEETVIRITIGDITLDGVLYDTALAEEIKAYFPLTISMAGYGGREYYGGVDFYPENLEGGQKNFENGDITYCEAHHNRTYDYRVREAVPVIWLYSMRRPIILTFRWM